MRRFRKNAPLPSNTAENSLDFTSRAEEDRRTPGRYRANRRLNPHEAREAPAGRHLCSIRDGNEFKLRLVALRKRRNMPPQRAWGMGWRGWLCAFASKSVCHSARY